MASNNANLEQHSNNNVGGWYVDQPKAGMQGCHRIKLQCPQGYKDPFGYGLRVVGQHIGNVGEEKSAQYQNSVSAFARVLWLSPGGVAESAGINVGDRVILHLFQKLKNILKVYKNEERNITF